MNYRPYIWMGEDQDAHVRAWREIESGYASRFSEWRADAWPSKVDYVSFFRPRRFTSSTGPK